MYLERRANCSAMTLDLLSVVFEEIDDPSGSDHRGLGGFTDTFKEELQPRFPVTFQPDSLQVVVVVRAMMLEVEAQIEQWLTQNALGPQQESDEESSYSTVAVEKGMNGLELRVRKCGLEENRNPLRRFVEEALEVTHAVGDMLGRRWNVGGKSRARAANPALRGPEDTRLLLSSTTACKQVSVDFSNQTVREREPLPESTQSVLQGSDIAGDLLHIGRGNSRRFIQLEEEQIGE